MVETLEEQSQIKTKRKRIKYRYNIRYMSAYAHYRIVKKFPEIKRNDCAKIINTYFEMAQDDLSSGNKISLMNKLGGLYLTKELREVEYDAENDKVINNLPVNIPQTLKLWKQRPELRNKTFVRFTNDHSGGFSFKLHFESSKAVFKNKRIYKFQFARPLKEKLVKNIFDKKVDAYLIPKKNE